MNRVTKLRMGVVGAAVLTAIGAGVSCKSTSGGTSTTSSGGSGTGGSGSDGGTPSNFTPQGCSFSIAPRMEYLSWGLSRPVVGATPNIRRVRLGLGGNVQGAKGRADPSTSIAMAWQTDVGTDASEVEWGTGSDPTQWPAANRVSGITWDTPPGSIGAGGNEHMHEVYICGLTPSTTYSYRVGGGPAGSEQWSPVFSFTTTPAGGNTSTVTIGITGDSRGEQNNAWQLTQERMLKIGPTMMLFSGDVINLAPDQGEWEQWLDSAESMISNDTTSYLTLPQILSLATHGNHENHSSLFYGNLTLPQDNTSATYSPYGELFYSVDVGPVHVIVTDDSWIADPTSDPDYPHYQPTLAAWLEADLTAAQANRSNVPWIIAVNHRSNYSSSDHGKDADVLLSRAFYVPLWQKYHVDVAFGGHDHDYERSYPLTVGADVNSPTNTTADQGTVFVVCAGSGADGYSNGTSSWTAVSKSYNTGGASFLGFYSVLTVDAHNFKIDSHQLMADGSDPIFDTYTITK